MSEQSQHQHDNGVTTTINQTIDTNINSNVTNINPRKRKCSVCGGESHDKRNCPTRMQTGEFFACL